MEEKGFIKKYVALIDAEKVGLGLLAYVNIRLNKHSGTIPCGTGENLLNCARAWS